MRKYFNIIYSASSLGDFGMAGSIDLVQTAHFILIVESQTTSGEMSVLWGKNHKPETKKSKL